MFVSYNEVYMSIQTDVSIIDDVRTKLRVVSVAPIKCNEPFDVFCRICDIPIGTLPCNHPALDKPAYCSNCS